MDKTMDNDEILEFIKKLQNWHENQTSQLQIIIDEKNTELSICNKNIPADSELAKGIRVGVAISLDLLGKLPFEVSQVDCDTQE